MFKASQVITGILVATVIGAATLPTTDVAACEPKHDPVETIATFDPAKLETPESIEIDADNNKYVSLALTGEIRKITPSGKQSTYALLPLGAAPLTFCGSFFAGLTGIVFDKHDNLYASLASCDPGSRGIWKIPRAGGQPRRIAALPMVSLPNGIVHHEGHVYVADSTLGVIWRASDDGGSAEVWASGDELAREGESLPGPNGLKLFHDELYVSNPSQGTIVAIEMQDDGEPGPSRIHADGVFCDDFAFDRRGALYCGTDPFDTLLRVAPDGSVETLLTAQDGLDGPTAVMFGRRGERSEIFVTTAAYPFLPGPATRRPSLMRVSLDRDGRVDD